MILGIFRKFHEQHTGLDGNCKVFFIKFEYFVHGGGFHHDSG